MTMIVKVHWILGWFGRRKDVRDDVVRKQRGGSAREKKRLAAPGGPLKGSCCGQAGLPKNLGAPRGDREGAQQPKAPPFWLADKRD